MVLNAVVKGGPDNIFNHHVGSFCNQTTSCALISLAFNLTSTWNDFTSDPLIDSTTSPSFVLCLLLSYKVPAFGRWEKAERNKPNCQLSLTDGARCSITTYQPLYRNGSVRVIRYQIVCSLSNFLFLLFGLYFSFFLSPFFFFSFFSFLIYLNLLYFLYSYHSTYLNFKLSVHWSLESFLHYRPRSKQLKNRA